MLLLFAFPFFYSQAQAQISFAQSNLNFNGNGGVSGGTSLMFGPDGRLYVLNINGTIDIFTIQRNGLNDYVVIASEEILSVKNIPNHNDDGASNSGNNREATGLTVAGTAANPIIYVTSSDSRIGGPSGDQNLDTNSGVITRLSWNGSSWVVVDLVRGLPRSEENHATNGLEFVTINGTDFLIVSQGGHTNAGSPSDNFAWTTEYALSAAVLSVNLTMLEAMPILTDGARSYIYDLPTLDDPTRANANGVADPDDPNYNGIDVGDPWGGNDGLNQAMIVLNGPVQVFSGGYRNTYDLVVTQSGAVFATDNGANGGWGGLPVNEGVDGTVTNDYISSEPGSSSSVGGEQVNNVDHLTMITSDIQSYTFGAFYGGHPTPVRANPAGAGLFTNPTANGLAGAIFRTQTYDPDGSTPGSTTDPSIALPANWPPVPVSLADPREGDWRGPGINNPDGPDDVLVTTWGTNTNGIDEYTASNFGGAMQGDLIAGKNGGILRRVQLNPDGSLLSLTSEFLSGIGGNALGVTCNSDSDPFPGTIWVAPYNGTIVVLEPQDFVICILPGEPGYDANADNDSDGYTNQDELDNGSDMCNGGSQPNDFDKSAGGSLLSDLNDTDDDNDGILDANDVFQLGDPTASGSDAFSLPVLNDLFSDNPELKGYLGLGFTGMMNNGDPNPNWLQWLDRRDDPSDPNPNDILGGAVGAMTMQMTVGTADGSANNQEKGFQYGVEVDAGTGGFTVEGRLLNFTDPLQLYGSAAPANGELGIFIGDGTQSNFLKVVLTQSGVEAYQEIGDVAQGSLSVAVLPGDRPASAATFYLTVNSTTGNVVIEYAFDGGGRQLLGNIATQGAILTAIQQSSSPLAVGLTGSSNTAGFEVEGTWDYLNVTGAQPTISQVLPNVEEFVGAAPQVIDLSNFFDDDNGTAGLAFSVESNSNPAIGATITGANLTLTFSATPEVSDITIRATDAGGLFVEQTFQVDVNDEPVVLFRVNAGDVLVPATDAPNPDWVANEGIGAQSGTGFMVNTGNISTHNIPNLHSSVPAYTPLSLFAKERWDPAGAPEMMWTFNTGNGTFIVNLYMGNGFAGTSGAGQRVFDINIEGVLVADNKDLSAQYGHQFGAMESYQVTVTDGQLNIEFIHQTENPLINAIEILGAGNGFLPISVAPVSAQSNNEGDIVNLTIQPSGGDPGENFAFSAIGLPAGLQIEPTTGLVFGTIDAGAAAQSPYSSVVTVSKPSSTPVDVAFTWNVGLSTSPSAALVEIMPGSTNINASTFGAGSFQITNTSPTANITSVTFDGTTGFIPNIVFDPNGTAGDPVGKPFTPNTNPGVGTIGHTYLSPLGNGGFQGLNVTFTDFNPGELFTFSIDQDPTSVEGLAQPGPNDAASVGGLEQAGSTITVAFDDGTTYVTNLYSDGSVAGGTSTPRANLPAAPVLTVDALVSPATTNLATHTIQISGGPANGTVSLLQVEAGFYQGGGNLNQEPYEVNKIISSTRLTGLQLNGNGEVSVQVTLTDSDAEAGYNYFLAAFEDGAEFGPTSNAAILYYDDQYLPPSTNVLYRVNTGGALVPTLDAPSPDWTEDSGIFGAAGNSVYLASLSPGNSTFAKTAASAYPGAIDMTDPSLPAGTPEDIFLTERYDADAAPAMLYQFPVAAGTQVEVRLYFAELFTGIAAAGERVFDVSIDGVVPAQLNDIDPLGSYGPLGAFMLSHTIISDGTVDIEFIHQVENPAIKGIEIVEVTNVVPSANVAISATLQGRSNFSGDYTMTLYPVGSNVATATYTATADAAGNMAFSGVAPGTWQVALKYPNSLQVVQTMTLVEGANSGSMGQLPMGDANDDNFVTALDFSVMVATFNKQSTDVGFDTRADFNGDGFVTSLDFSLMVTNFNQQGQEPSN
ncbi:MAG: malectin domain-containing carbohydrate-binding protein [Bacteroidia bacterium]|nr:malectin domain-containing carbohydrate-binding protein [Bacteroidia bacterium]